MSKAFLVFDQDDISRADISFRFSPFLVAIECSDVVAAPEKTKFPGEMLTQILPLGQR